MEKNIAAIDLKEAEQKAKKYEILTGMRLVYKETIGFVPGAVFVFDCIKYGE